MNDLRLNIWRMQAQADTQGLIRLLDERDGDVRRRAAAALRTLGATEAIPALRAAVDNEKDIATRLHLAAALRHLLQESIEQERASAEEVNRLIEMLRSGQPLRVIEAASTLGRMKNRLAVGPLVVTFNDSTLPGRARMAAARALLAMDSAPAVVTLLGALDSDDWHIQRNALAVLGHLRADWAVESIQRFLSSDNALIRRTARAALKSIGTPEALAALAVAEPDSDAVVIETYQRSTADTQPRPPRPEPEQQQPAPHFPPSAPAEGG